MSRKFAGTSGDDRIGRTLGAVVFIIGIVILVVAACATYRFFSFNSATVSAATGGGSAVPITARLTESACQMLRYIAGLIVMSMIGSLIAGRGLQMYMNTPGEEDLPRGKAIDRETES